MERVNTRSQSAWKKMSLSGTRRMKRYTGLLACTSCPIDGVTDPSQIPLVDAAKIAGGTRDWEQVVWPNLRLRDLTRGVGVWHSLWFRADCSGREKSLSACGSCASSARRWRGPATRRGDESSVPPTPSAGGDGGSPAVDRVITVKNCPLCHRPRLNVCIDGRSAATSGMVS